VGLLAVEVDTFRVYKIAERRYDRNLALIPSILFTDNSASRPAFQKERKKYESNYIYTM
jgi:hypothetical protein